MSLAPGVGPASDVRLVSHACLDRPLVLEGYSDRWLSCMISKGKLIPIANQAYMYIVNLFKAFKLFKSIYESILPDKE